MTCISANSFLEPFCFSLPLPKYGGGVEKESKVRMHIGACASGGRLEGAKAADSVHS